ncbi:hypothetical protein [Rivularia sp. UHCC 0363]|nr:hypothetical protein [Rivularia sp. UHCC 0363]MEA5594182.1 hypothetical protein [Rivularia sp. UHCC 0363]
MTTCRGGGRWGDREMGRWGRWGDGEMGEMGRWGELRILKNNLIYLR